MTDRRGQFLTDLTAEDFEILEDGKPQTLQHFARGDDLETGPELHVGLLFDTSGSMDADIKMSRSAAVKFLNTMNDARDMTLVDFDTEVRVTKFSQQDFPRLVERIRSRKPEGFTAMYDALGVYLDGAADDDGTEDPRRLHRRRRHPQRNPLRRCHDADPCLRRDGLRHWLPPEPV